MTKTSPFVITISRQLGSGGAYLGQRLALHLNALYLDHEIVRQAAQELKVPEEHVAVRDERVTSNWQSMLQSWRIPIPGRMLPLRLTSSTMLNSTKLNRISLPASPINVPPLSSGAAGIMFLRNHPKTLNVFIHADLDFRQKAG